MRHSQLSSGYAIKTSQRPSYLHVSDRIDVADHIKLLNRLFYSQVLLLP